MEEKAAQRMEILRQIAKADPVYQQLMAELKPLERRYDEVLNTIGPERMNIICDFVMMCEEISRRELELACIWLRFP